MVPSPKTTVLSREKILMTCPSKKCHHSFSLCRDKLSGIDTAQLRDSASSVADSVVEQASRAAEWAAPHVSRARSEAAKAAKEAQSRLEPAYAEARTRVVEDYIPRAQRAAYAAQTAAQSTDGTLGERAQAVALAAKSAALKAPAPKKKHRVLKTLGFLTVAGAASAAAYVLWRRSQPVEDPWAEEYWADAEAEKTEPVESVVAEPASEGIVADEKVTEDAPFPTEPEV